jgi:putative transposase
VPELQYRNALERWRLSAPKEEVVKINKAYRTELDPNDVQTTLLRKHAGAARAAWNWALNRRIEEYKLTGKSSNAIEQHRQLNSLKPVGGRHAKIK